MSVRHFEEDLKAALDDPDGTARFERERLQPFTDTIGRFAKWYGFSKEYWERVHENESNILTVGTLKEPASNPYRHVGRNDPCPCGSGKKFKRCCLN